MKSKKLVEYLIAGAASIASTSHADMIYKGARGPTEWQADVRPSFYRNEKASSAAMQNILKYWNGKDADVFAFASLPYRMNFEPQESRGFGDVSFGIGPRFSVGDRYGSAHSLSYAGMTLPAGSQGNKRRDAKAGTFWTFLTPKNGFEVDASLEYAKTGRNDKGTNPPNETSTGAIAGMQAGKKFRVAAGGTMLKRDENYISNFRASARYTPSKRHHAEVMVERGFRSKGIPKGTMLVFVYRRNL